MTSQESAYAPVHSADVDALNEIAGFLALNDFPPGGCPIEERPIDCIIWAGNAVLHTAEQAFRLVRDGTIPRILLSGGVGHSTRLLWQAVARHEDYRTVTVEGRAEACILKDIAERFWNIDPLRILLEDASTNSGENAVFSRQVLEDRDIAADAILLVQDPTMQRRTDATFRHIWRDRPSVRFYNWPTFTPRVALTENGMRYDLGTLPEPWSMERFISLVMGEIPRLRNDESGYGPRGKGFIGAVEIPDRIEAAYIRLSDGIGSRFSGRAAIKPPV